MFNFKEGTKRIWHIGLLIYFLIISPIIYDFFISRNTDDLVMIIFLVTLPFILKLIFNYVVEGFKKK